MTETTTEESVDEVLEDEDFYFSDGYDELNNLAEEGNRAYIKVGDSRVWMFIDGNPADLPGCTPDTEIHGVRRNAPVCRHEYGIGILNAEGKYAGQEFFWAPKGKKNPRTGKPFPDHVKSLSPGERPYYAGYFTIVDITDAVDEDFNIVNRSKIFRNILMVKKKELKKLQKRCLKKKGLRGTIWEVGRDENNDPRSGNDWQFEAKWNDEQIREALGDQDKPFDYAKELAPRPREDVEAALAHKAPPYGQKNEEAEAPKKGRQRHTRKAKVEHADEVDFGDQQDVAY